MIDKSVFINGVVDKYPSELLEDRLTIEGNLISCYMKDMLLLDTAPIDKDDWLLNDSKFYYLMITNLRSKGFYSLDEVTILSNFPDKVIERYNELGGWNSISHLIDIINTENFDAYLENMDHSNILLKLHKDGFNLFNEIKLMNGKMVKPFNLFKNMTAEEVSDWYQARVNGYNRSISNKVIDKGNISYDDSFIEDCMEGELNGVPFANCLKDIDGDEIRRFPFISNQLMGFLPGTFSMLGAYSGVGKTILWINIIMSLMAQGRKVLVISNEVNRKGFKIRIMMFMLYLHNKYYNLTKKKLQKGDITEEDKRQIRIAGKWWNENFEDKFEFVHLSDMDMNVVKQNIRDYVLRYGFDTVLIDTFKLDFSVLNTDSSGRRTDLHLVEASRTLDSLAAKLNIVCLASLQLALRTQGTLFLNSAVLSESKQIKEVLESLMLMRNVYPEELDPEDKKYYCHPFRLKNVDGKWIEEEYQVDPNSVYRVLFIDKTRSGATSSDTGVAYLLKYRGDYCVFSESAQCRPRHGMIV